ncbi:hypothetical protein BGZ67_002465 [Mortierella alpina]|nr:hypothetical protein BGZ67_002465 [Mortierella alpina]
MLNHQAEFGIILSEVYDPALAMPSGEVTPRRVQTAPESVQAVDNFQAVMREMRDILLPEVDKLELTVVRPLQELQNNMKLIRRTITKRDHKLLDYDRFRISLKKLQDKKERTLSDEKQIYKLESQLEVATSDYEGLNGLLREELPGFFYYKTQLIEPIFQSFFYLQLHIYNVMLDRMGTLAGSGYYDLSKDVMQGYEARKPETEPTVESVEIITKRSVTATYTSKYGRPSHDADPAPGAYGAPAAMPNESRGYSPPAPAAKPWQTGGAAAGSKPWEAGASSSGAKPWQTGAAHEAPKPWQAGAASTSLNPRTSPPPPAYNAAQSGATTSTQQPGAGAGSRFKPPSNVHVHLAPSISGTIAATAAAAATSHAVNSVNAGISGLQAQAAHKGPPPPVPKRLALRTAVALYDYDAQQEGDLSFRKDDRIEIVERTADVNGWWTGRLNGRQGAFPDSVAVKDPYEEVFSLFTTETADAPWAHNRSVSQQASRLEVELDFTPAPSPTVSRPGSRPDSRTGSYFPSTSTASAECTDLLMEGEASQARPGSSLGMVETSGMPASPSTPTGSKSPLSATAPAGVNESGLNNSNVSNNNSNVSKPKNPAARALLGSRKSSRTGSGSGPGSPVRIATPQPKKPVVIHQSLSTLSQPGQTGTVVWDSSILMAKFMLSIKSLSRTCYRHQARKSRKASHQQQQRRQSEAQSRLQAQREQIRRLEEQAERMAVAEDGALTLREDASMQHPHLAAVNDIAMDGDRNSNTTQHSKDGKESEDEVASADDIDTEDEDEDEDEDEEGVGQEHLVFDPAETSILELGSGCGLLGIVMAELCQDLLLTDQKAVLPLLVKNLRKNLDKKYFDQDASSSSVAAHTGSIVGSGSTTAGSRKKKALEDSNGTNGHSNNLTTTKPCHIQVQELVWGQDLDQDLTRGFGLDFIVATDVVYNESIVPKLVQTLKELCEVRERVRKQLKDGHGDRFDKLQELLSTAAEDARDCASLRMRRMDKTVVLLAQELRTDYVHLSFLERLEKEGFRMVRMPKQLLDADYHSGYVVYALFLR